MTNKYAREEFFTKFTKIENNDFYLNDNKDGESLWRWIEAYADKEVEHERYRIIRVIVRVVDEIEAEGQGNTSLFQRIRNSIIDTFDNSEIVERVLDVREGE